MKRKIKIHKANYREDFNVLILEVSFLDNGENKTLVMNAGKTTKEVADENCKKIEGKEITLDMRAEVQEYDRKSLSDLTEGQFAAIMEQERAKMTQYPYAAAVQLLRERHPEDFPQGNSPDVAAWYSFPEEKDEIKQTTEKSD